MKTYKQYKDSHYVLSDVDFDETEACDEVIKHSDKNLEFIEFDSSVAQHYGYKFCAIFHEKEQES